MKGVELLNIRQVQNFKGLLIANKEKSVSEIIRGLEEYAAKVVLEPDRFVDKNIKVCPGCGHSMYVCHVDKIWKCRKCGYSTMEGVG